MNESHQEVFEKLEEAVAQWGTEVSGAQQGLAEELSRARGRIDAAGGDLATVGRMPALLQELREGMDSLRELLLRKAETEPVAMQALPELREVQAAVEALRSEVEGVRRDLDEMRERLGALPRIAESLDRLTAFAADAPAASATPRGNLAPAMHNETWQEVARLRAQLEDEGTESSAPVDLSQIERLAYDAEGHRRRIGEILQAAGILKDEQIERALAEQEQAPFRRLGAILVEKGLAPEEVVARVLAGQLRTRYVQLSTEPIDPAAVALVNARMARRHSCLPIAATEDIITLAIANPFDLVAIDDVELASQRRVETVVATAADIGAAIRRFHGG